MRSKSLLCLAASAVALVAVAAAPAAAETVKLKLGHWVADGHAMSKWLRAWAEGMKEKTGGAVEIEVFPGGQLGPVPQYYDMTRRGTIDIGWILHGATADRFPLTGLIDIPYTVDNAVMGTNVINDKELRAKYLDAEHRGVKNLLLFTHQPAHIHTAEKPVNTVADMKGLRIRFPSAVAKTFLEELGATPAGVPPTQIAENLQKKVIDGTLIDYGGAGIAFKLGGLVKHTTEINSYVTSFALIMNEDAYAKIPAAAKAAFDKTLVGVETEVGKAWDSLDVPGKKALLDGGMTVIIPKPEVLAEFKAAAQRVEAKLLEEREKAGHPAKEVYAMMKAKAAAMRK